MGPSMATPAEHIHPTSQSTPHSCPEKCYYKWHKSQIEDFVHKKHESWGKKMGKKTSQPLPWPKDPPRLPGFGFFFLTWNKKGGRKEVNCFQTDVYSPLKTCTTINTADGEMTQAGIIEGIQRARNYTTVICGVPVTGQLEELCWSKPPMLLSP